ncbi:helix-turn-helix transcriptional regulator [Nocardia vermiculata]|uniref:Helix-turn-helix transcriptional regulator n=1 Tax=Nocardia vermiculata TaxID=257274 RepID=A0A846Y4P1_9NOCA|nr:helix-turn-helix transcriptional regulator [Nocardia vermiculata]
MSWSPGSCSVSRSACSVAGAHARRRTPCKDCGQRARSLWRFSLPAGSIGRQRSRFAWRQWPAPGWTIDSLAAELTISRSTLTRRFRTVTGAPPADYLTRWRMDLAAIRLRDTDDTLDTIARSVGYTSVYAFSRAFRRIRSQAPGQFRSAVRATDRVPTLPLGSTG